MLYVTTDVEDAISFWTMQVENRTAKPGDQRDNKQEVGDRWFWKQEDIYKVDDICWRKREI